jgi:hypothetical protein
MTFVARYIWFKRHAIACFKTFVIITDFFNGTDSFMPAAFYGVWYCRICPLIRCNIRPADTAQFHFDKGHAGLQNRLWHIFDNYFFFFWEPGFFHYSSSVLLFTTT